MKCVILVITFMCMRSTTAAFYWGSCPNVTVKRDFVIDRYLGQWFEITHYSPSPFENDDSRCAQANYSLSQEEPGAIAVENSAILPDGTLDFAVGILRVPDLSEPAKLKVKFGRFMPAGNYWVLDTDYDTWAMVHSCTNHIFGLFHTQWDWIISRDRYFEYESPLIDEVFVKFIEQGIDTLPFLFSKQEECYNNTMIWNGGNAVL